VALLDRRVTTRGYGELFRSNLPPARWTDDRAEVAAFFRRFRGEKNKEGKG
jgi:Rad3-related DNA helicase